jgi:hypothetical protein
MKNLFILFMLATSVMRVFAQEKNDKSVAYSQPVRIAWVPKESVLKKYGTKMDADCKSSPLFAPKDEFETDAIYAQRQKEAAAFRESLIEKYRLKYIEVLKEEQRQRIAAEEIRIQKIKKSFKTVKIGIDQLGTYNADQEFFPVTICGKNFELKIPRAEAKSFKDKLSAADIQADKQLLEDARTVDCFNIVITHPVSGSKYVLGEKKPLYRGEERRISSGGGIKGIPKLVTSVKFSEPSGNNLLDAGENGRLEISIRNDGTGAAYMLKVKTNGPASGVSFDAEKVVQEINPGQSNVVSISLKGSQNISDDSLHLNISFQEESGFQPAPLGVTIGTRAYRPSKLAFKEFTLKDSDGDNIISNSEMVAITCLVQNSGQGKAPAAKVVFATEDPNVKFINDNELSQNLGDVAPGESKTVQFTMVVNNQYAGSDELPVYITLSDAEGNASAKTSLGLLMKKVQQATNTVRIQGSYEKDKAIPDVSLRSDVDKDIPESAIANPNRYALIIGNENYSKYQNGLQTESNVEFAINDARIFAEYAEKVLGVPKENITLLTDAISSKIKSEIEKLSKLAKYIDEKEGDEQAELIFYYAGHGFPDEVSKEPYLIPVDISGANVQNGIKLADLYRSLTSSPVKKVSVFLDACFSGGGREAGLLAARAIKIKAKEEEIKGNLVVLTASNGEQSSLPYKEKQHGMFTYFLLKKLKESRGNLNFGELASYLKGEVQVHAVKVNSKEQNPGVLYSNEVKDQWESWSLK